jgi:hypothetical protein
MRHYVAACALAVGCSCNSLPPPETISVDPVLPPEVMAGALIARDAWCASPVGWCPEIGTGAAASAIVPDSWGSEARPDEEYGAWAHNDGAFIGLSREALSWGTVTAEMWGCALSHEFGHYVVRGHLDDPSLMRPVIVDPYACSPVVDDATIAAWCEQQGC